MTPEEHLLAQAKSLAIVQGSDAWLKIRLGKVTASEIPNVSARIKNGWGASRTKYMWQLYLERRRNEPLPGRFVTQAMQDGKDNEPKARATYQLETGNIVKEVGFCLHPTIPNAGASPDGLVGDDGLLEIKCPEYQTHGETMQAREIPSKYIPQMQFQMACTGRAWCDFVSFNPLFVPEEQYFCERLVRDPAAIAQIEKDVVQFLLELDAMILGMIQVYGKPEAA